MSAVLAFAGVLLLAVLVSDLANRSVLSTAVLFLAAGVLLGGGGLGVLSLGEGNASVGLLAELALFSVLFTDGMRLSVRELKDAWRLPGRALAFGLPLTLAITAAFAHFSRGCPGPNRSCWVPHCLLPILSSRRRSSDARRSRTAFAIC